MSNSNDKLPKNYRLTPCAVLAIALLSLTASRAAAAVVTYDPGDPTMAYLQLAAPPVQLGPTDDHPGMWEYVYDFYHAEGTWESRIQLDGFEADLIANVHDIGFGVGVYQQWSSQAYAQPPLWGGDVDKRFLPSYANGAGWQLPSEGACVGCTNETYEYLNEWHSPYEYNSSIFYGTGHYPFGEVNIGGMLSDADAGITGNDTVIFPVWNPGFPNQFSVGGLGITFRIVHPNAPGTVRWNTYHWNANDIVGEIVGPSASVAGPCAAGIVGDANCDGYVDISNDILVAFTNFTGPGSFAKTRAQGDVHGPSEATATNDPHDTDVDVSDILTMFGAFTGPAPDETGQPTPAGLLAAEAGDPSIPDLIYDPATGEVIFDLDGAAGLIGYSLKSAGGFLAGGHTPILGGVTTSLPTELAEAALSTPALPASIGFVFPLGMDLAALSAFLTENTVSTGLGAPLVPFDLVVLGPAVPEPATILLSAAGLLGLVMVGLRGRSRGATRHSPRQASS